MIRTKCGRNGPAAVNNALSAQPRDDIGRTHVLTRTVGAPLYLDLAFGEPLGTDDDLPGNADQVGTGEFRACALVRVVVEHVDAPVRKLLIELFAGAIDRRVALLQIEDGGAERRHRLRPF